VPEDNHTILTFHFYHHMLIRIIVQVVPGGEMYDDPSNTRVSRFRMNTSIKSSCLKAKGNANLTLAGIEQAVRASDMVADLAKPIAVSRSDRTAVVLRRILV